MRPIRSACSLADLVVLRLRGTLLRFSLDSQHSNQAIAAFDPNTSVDHPLPRGKLLFFLRILSPQEQSCEGALLG